MNESLLNINNIKSLLQQRKVVWTKHCLNRLNQRDISIMDIKTAINFGRIVEFYEDDYPYLSCLILGKSINCEILHIVCGINNDLLYMITAYHPDKDKWKEDMKTRRENNELF